MSKLPEYLKELFPEEDHFGKLIGYQYLEHGQGWIKTCLKIGEKHISPSGVAHGGAISAFVDWSMGAAVFTILKPGQLCSTIEFKINYLSPAKLGETIYCKATVKFHGRSHAVIEFHVFREEGKDVAMGVGTYNIYS